MNRIFKAGGAGLRFSVALICALLLGALVIGCGGGRDETITKAAFVDQGNAICKKALRERTAAERDYFEGQAEGDNTPPSQAIAEKQYLAVVMPHIEPMVTEFEELDSSDPEAAAFVGSLQDGVNTLESETAEVFKGTVDPFQEARKKAKDLGLNACAEF